MGGNPTSTEYLSFCVKSRELRAAAFKIPSCVSSSSKIKNKEESPKPQPSKNQAVALVHAIELLDPRALSHSPKKKKEGLKATTSPYSGRDSAFLKLEESCRSQQPIPHTLIFFFSPLSLHLLPARPSTTSSPTSLPSTSTFCLIHQHQKSSIIYNPLLQSHTTLELHLA